MCFRKVVIGFTKIDINEHFPSISMARGVWRRQGCGMLKCPKMADMAEKCHWWKLLLWNRVGSVKNLCPRIFLYFDILLYQSWFFKINICKCDWNAGRAVDKGLKMGGLGCTKVCCTLSINFASFNFGLDSQKNCAQEFFCFYICWNTYHI